MKIHEWLAAAQTQLHQAGIATARLDSQVLLSDALHKDKAYLLAHPDMTISAPLIPKLKTQLAARAQHTPLAYIRGLTEFYGRDFYINESVLEPRPESEPMIDLLKQLPRPQHLIDVGTGSGALAITAKLELPQTDVTAVDIDPQCLAIARQNAKKHQVTDITFLESDLLAGITLSQNTILLCNLPYVPETFTLNQAALNEPKIAIFGGPDGLDHYRQLFAWLQKAAVKPSYILTESLPFQHADLVRVAHQAGYTPVQEEDFIQVFTVTGTVPA